MSKQGFLYGGGLGKPHQKPSSTESLGCTLRYTLGAHKEYQLFCCDLVALPTTAAAKEREGKPGHSQQLKIDTTYKNQATHLGLVYKKHCLCTIFLFTPRLFAHTVDHRCSISEWIVLYENLQLSSHHSWGNVESILSCKHPMCAVLITGYASHVQYSLLNDGTSKTES